MTIARVIVTAIAAISLVIILGGLGPFIFAIEDCSKQGIKSIPTFSKRAIVIEIIGIALYTISTAIQFNCGWVVW